MAAKNSEPEIVISADGSHTLFHPGVGDHYHSTYGAISESKHIFIEAGLHSLMAKSGQVSVLEIGFGTGLNAWLTCLEASRQGIMIKYVAIEPYPLNPGLIGRLNYPDLVRLESGKERFLEIHNAPEEEWSNITGNFALKKIRSKFQDSEIREELFDLVYFDAFAPDLQPELWTIDVFRKIYGQMNLSGVLVTYSSKGIVKRTLASAGFRVEKLPGPAGKREILRARKI